MLWGSSSLEAVPTLLLLRGTVSSIVPLLYMSVCLSVYRRDQVEVSLFLPRTYDAPVCVSYARSLSRFVVWWLREGRGSVVSVVIKLVKYLSLVNAVTVSTLGWGRGPDMDLHYNALHTSCFAYLESHIWSERE